MAKESSFNHSLITRHPDCFLWISDSVILMTICVNKPLALFQNYLVMSYFPPSLDETALNTSYTKQPSVLTFHGYSKKTTSKATFKPSPTGIIG